MFDNSTIGEYHGYKCENFTFNGHGCTVVIPEDPSADKKWIWRAEFLGAFDSVDVDMLSKGYYLAYCAVNDRYGDDVSVEIFKAFYDYMTDLGFNKKTVLFGFSRGGLYACNFALKYPEAVAALYLDAPVLDIQSWPGGLMSGVGAEREFNECLGLYGLDKTSVLDFKKNPVDRLDELLSLKMPVVLVAGDSDEVVPYVENGKYLEELYKNSGGDLLCIVKPGCGHHPHSIPDPTPVTEFLMKKY